MCQCGCKGSNLQSIPRTGTHLQWLGLGLLITMATFLAESPWETYKKWKCMTRFGTSYKKSDAQKKMHSVISIKRCDKRIWHFTRTGWKKIGVKICFSFSTNGQWKEVGDGGGIEVGNPLIPVWIHVNDIFYLAINIYNQ